MEDHIHHHTGAGGMMGPMVFHMALREPLLFSFLVPITPLQYALACAAIVASGLTSQFLKLSRTSLQAQPRARRISNEETVGILVGGSDRQRRGSVSEESHAAPASFRSARLALLTGAIVSLDYLVMLAAMTLNVGYFAAAVGGHSLGVLLFTN
jgi:hypothetical protein